MDIDKRDLLTITVISIVFFSIAAWNLGLTQAPITTWQTSQDQSFYIDLGRTENIDTVYLLVKNGSATTQAYIGSPGNWNSQGILPLSITYPYDYYSWSKITIESYTQYVRFHFENASVEVAELAVLDQDNQKVPIVAIVGENESSQDLTRLIDEQGLVECPPTYMSETFFDEIYYVKTAENYLKLEYPYEWTHPPLGKLIIAFGIFAFGYSPFVWRIMGVIFATLMLPIIYVLGKKLFGTWIGAFTSAFLLAFDFMHFTMARMATVDTYVVFFSLASQLFFLIYIKDVFKNGWKASIVPLFLGFLFFALGFSTKWFVLYGFIGLIAFLLILRLRDVTKLKETWSAKLNALLDPPFYLLPLFLLMAILIYFLTFIPDMIVGRSIIDVLGLQGSMYIYHSTLSATHPFSSAWWSWPLMLRPVWLYVSYLPLDVKSTITLLGNPAVWWLGFISIIIVTAKAIPSRIWKKLPKLKFLANDQPSIDWIALFIVVVFFFQWVPYVFISRITFIYHYYLNVPLLCLASAYLVSKCWPSKWGKIATFAFFVAVVILFALFYPVISGMPSSTTSIDSLKWFESWVF
jgi:dolichyl-phosphate-mannose--protein O-mannosyl transferase